MDTHTHPISHTVPISWAHMPTKYAYSKEEKKMSTESPLIDLNNRT